MKKCVITVVGKDRVGIIGKVCTYLAQESVNVLNITQTIVDGYFNMFMIVDVSGASKNMSEIASELDRLGMEICVQIHMQREEIFEKMHRL